MLNNVFFDTCVYHQPDIDLLTRMIPVQHSVRQRDDRRGRGIDPETGHYFGDTKCYVEAASIEPEARYKIYEGNVRCIYPRLDAALKAKGR